MYVIHRHNVAMLAYNRSWIYWANAKVASRQLIRGVLAPHGRKHLSPKVEMRVGKGLFRNAYKFSLVRNPFARAVSSWRWLMKVHGTDLQRHYGQGVPEMSFLEFSRLLVEQGPGFDVHCHLQSPGLEHDWFCDDVYHLESIDKDWEQLRRKLNLRVAPLRKNPGHSSSGDTPWREWYSDESKDNIAYVYGEDLHRLGYCFEQDGPVER